MRFHRANVVALVGLLAACSGHDTYGNSRPTPVQPVTIVRVRNTNWMDVTVFAVRGVTRKRIGFVTALATTSFTIPEGLAPDRTIRLLVDPVGSDRTFLADAVALMPGQTIELTVMPSLNMSSVAVWGQ
jgi:hypothetical protein